jgi:hypothetical protein
VVERGGLENRYTFTGIGGSNPPLSAIFEVRRQRAEGQTNCGSFFLLPSDLRLLPSKERWPSGLRRTLGKRVYVKSVPWVRIPLSPPSDSNVRERLDVEWARS